MGAALAVVISLLLWPEWQRNHLATVMRKTLTATGAYLDAVLKQLDERPGDVARPLAELRRDACLAIDQFEALLYVLHGALPSSRKFALCIPSASPSPSFSYTVRHIEQEMVAGVLAVSAELSAA